MSSDGRTGLEGDHFPPSIDVQEMQPGVFLSYLAAVLAGHGRYVIARDGEWGILRGGARGELEQVLWSK